MISGSLAPESQPTPLYEEEKGGRQKSAQLINFTCSLEDEIMKGTAQHDQAKGIYRHLNRLLNMAIGH